MKKRILAILSAIIFIINCLPAMLHVTADAPDSLQLMCEVEYDDSTPSITFAF